jgi:hypothetical protein
MGDIRSFTEKIKEVYKPLSHTRISVAARPMDYTQHTACAIQMKNEGAKQMPPLAGD